MQGKRTDRVGHLIQMELSQLILHKLKDPRLGFVTITYVSVTPDLKSACVFYSSLGDEKARRDTGIALEKACGYLQRQVGAVLQLRNTPRLKFLYDESIDKGLEVDQVLRKIHDEDANA